MTPCLKRARILAVVRIHLGSVAGWQAFVRASARSRLGRPRHAGAREARSLAFGTAGKLRVLADLLAEHHLARTLISPKTCHGVPYLTGIPHSGYHAPNPGEGAARHPAALRTGEYSVW